MSHPSIHAQTNPDKVAYQMAGSGEALTYRQLDERSNQGAHLLRALGLHAGEHVALLLENSLAFMEIVWAAQRAGLYYTAISRYLTPGEIAYIVQDCGAKVFIVSPASAPAGARGERVGRLVRGSQLYISGAGADTPPGYRSWDEALAPTAQHAPRRRDRRLRHALLVGHHRPPQGGASRPSSCDRSPR